MTLLGIQQFKKELRNILLWWQDQIFDDKDRIIGRIDGLNKKYPESDIGLVMVSRIIWTFSAASRNSDNPSYRKVAELAYSYLRNYFYDQVNGGYYWMIDYSGRPINKKKQVYAQAFVIYALTEYHSLTGDQNVLEQALEVFQLIEDHSRDEEKEGYWEALSDSWEKMKEVRLSNKDANEVKTMNTHLHVLECYTNLYKCKQDIQIKNALKDLIRLYAFRFIDPETGRLKLFFDEDWNERITHDSFGHEIESVWLLNEAAEVLGDEILLFQIRAITMKIAERVMKIGLNSKGALYNERKPNGHYEELYDWWPQAEAVIGFYDAYRLTENKAYLVAADNVWQFINDYIIDPENGEWFWGVDKDLNPVTTEDKAGPWKAPYHNGRMCMEMIKRLDS